MPHNSAGEPASERTAADWLLLCAVVLSGLAYLVLNKPTGQLHSLTTSLDRRIPLEPIFSVPYLLFLPVFWLIVLWAFIRRRWWRPLAAAIIVAYLISDATYLLFQTYVVRPPVPGHSVFDSLVRFIYRSDNPYNDFPSTHSASAAILAAYLVVTRSAYRFVGAAFALLVVVSTLFVKQHVIADAVAGVVLGTAAVIGALLTTQARPG